MLLVVRSVESWTAGSRVAGVLLLAACLVALVAWSRRMLGRRAGQITSAVVTTVAVVAVVVWAVVRVIDGA